MSPSPRESLSLVASSDAQHPPYSADTKAKGWRFELDYERIEQSDTWVLASSEMRPWLLMLWMTAWKQVPCGSLPPNDELVSARIGMDLRVFKANRDILMRGWVLASDGRLYHPVITEQVLNLVGLRNKESARKQAYRDKKNQAHTVQSPAGQTRDSYGIPMGATTPEPEPEPVSLVVTDVTTRPANAEPVSKKAKVSECNHKAVVTLYHEVLPTLNRVEVWNDYRQGLLRSRWREVAQELVKDGQPSDEAAILNWWRSFFGYIGKSKWLTGRVEGNRDSPFKADLEWIIRPKNFAKIIEGAYHRSK